MLSHLSPTRENKRAHHSEASRFHKITERTDPRPTSLCCCSPPHPICTRSDTGGWKGEQESRGPGWVSVRSVVSVANFSRAGFRG